MASRKTFLRNEIRIDEACLYDGDCTTDCCIDERCKDATECEGELTKIIVGSVVVLLVLLCICVLILI